MTAGVGPDIEMIGNFPNMSETHHFSFRISLGNIKGCFETQTP